MIAALERWKLAVDDSGGDALADTPAGLFARLAAEAALGGLAPVALLGLLKHPLMRLGAAQGAHARAIAALEKAVLRGPRPRPGSGGLAHALAAFRAELAKLRRKEASDLHPSDPRADLTEAELDARRRPRRPAERGARAARRAAAPPSSPRSPRVTGTSSPR